MWPTYVINLADNTARLDAVNEILGAQGILFERVDGVNGWALPEDEIARVYDASRNAKDGRYPLVPAEIGCYLSHIAAWQRIAEGDAAGGFIFEDDFAATSQLANVMAALSADTVGDWDMVKLFTLDDQVSLGASRALLDGVQIGIPYRVPTCLIGYALTKDAAARLVARVPPFFRPVDEDQKFIWETGLRVALVLPPPVVLGDQQAATGTVGGARRSARRSGFRQFLHQVLYALDYRRALARHRRREGWDA
ncbi:glycosyltransferase family 25 protein [Jannaschia helgolandensis]|uniref:glycosyltransferase family 25 protein n=1 Tax=Jannaschia helgolandensis TaxID=188906 RepID=UPI0030D81DED